MGLLSVVKRSDLIAAILYLKGACKKDGEGLFATYSDRTRGNGLKLRVALD